MTFQLDPCQRAVVFVRSMTALFFTNNRQTSVPLIDLAKLGEVCRCGCFISRRVTLSREPPTTHPPHRARAHARARARTHTRSCVGFNWRPLDISAIRRGLNPPGRAGRAAVVKPITLICALQCPGTSRRVVGGKGPLKKDTRISFHLDKDAPSGTISSALCAIFNLNCSFPAILRLLCELGKRVCFEYEEVFKENFIIIIFNESLDVDK